MSETAAPVRSHVAWWLLVLVGVGVAAWCAAGAGTRAANGGRLTADEPQYVLTAISLGEDFDLDISDERTEQRFRDFHRAALPVQEKLRDVFETRREKTMFIVGDPTLRYGEIIQVIDAARGAGVEKVGIVTEGMRRGE